MPATAALRDSVTFERRGLDANGDPLGPWGPVMTVRAQLNWLRGSETALAERLESRQPVAIVIRDGGLASEITTAWRAVNARKPSQKFNITACAPHRDRGFVEVLATMGGATG